MIKILRKYIKQKDLGEKMEIKFNFEEFQQMTGKPCPCKIGAMPYNVCPCKAFREKGKCICGLYEVIKNETKQ